MAVLAFIGVSLCALTLVNENPETFDTIGQGFADWIATTRPDIYNSVDEAVLKGKIKETSEGSGVFSFPVNAGFLVDLGSLFITYLNSVGTVSDSAFDYVAVTDVSNAMVNSMDDYRAFSDPLFMRTFNMDTVNWGFNRYVDAAGPDGRAYNSFYRTVDNNNGNVDFVIVKSYSSFGLDGLFVNGCYGVNISSSNTLDFINANYVSNHSFELLGTLYYDTSLSESTVDSSAQESIGLTDEGKLYTVAPGQFMQDILDKVKGSTITHYPDGSTAVEDDQVKLGMPAKDTTGTNDWELDQDKAKETPFTDLAGSPDTDTTGAEESAPVGSTSWPSKVLSWFDTFWAKIVSALKTAGDYILNGIKRIFVPEPQVSQRMIADIREVFEDKFFIDFFY